MSRLAPPVESLRSKLHTDDEGSSCSPDSIGVPPVIVPVTPAVVRSWAVTSLHASSESEAEPVTVPPLATVVPEEPSAPSMASASVVEVVDGEVEVVEVGIGVAVVTEVLVGVEVLQEATITRARASPASEVSDGRPELVRSCSVGRCIVQF